MRLRGGAGKPGTPAGSVSRPAKGPGTTGDEDRTGRRPARVRNRLVGAVAVVAVAVLGAGAPAIATAADNAQQSQQLVDLAELDAHALSLAHSLADERDTMTAFVAAGRSARGGAEAAQPQRARVDRQIRELRSEAHGAAGETAVYKAADKLLIALPQTRGQALRGPGTAEQTFEAYTRAVQALGAISDDIARGLPARADAADADTRALPALGRAVDQAAGTRGLLLSALNAGGPQPGLTAAAQLAHLRGQGALEDFAQSASEGARDRYDRTVNGTDVATAERYLARLTDQPRLSGTDLRLNRERVRATLTSRVGLMRGVESAMATAEIQRLGALRDDDVTALEIRIGLEGLCLLLAVGAGISGARSMTRPLAVLRLGAQRVAADPGAEEPITFTGRDDEFAAAVRSVNALHAQVGELAQRTAELEGERKRLVSGRQRMVAEREVLQDQAIEFKQEVAELTERLAALRAGVHGRFVNLSLRTLGLVERQLGVIEGLEESEQDPERLETLFKLDHFAARMRRNSENLLVLAGSEHGTGHAGPVPLLDVLRASVSEIERYERVRIQSLPPHSQVAGFAADDISHLVAELLENATAFSPPDAHVELSGWLLESGEIMLSVQDEGIGMTGDRLAELNDRLSDAEAASSSETIDEALGLGLYVVVRLAARHGVRVQLRDSKQGGVTAVVVLPGSILPTRPDPSGIPSVAAHDAPYSQSLPGSVAEANSNTLQTRAPRSMPPAAEPAPAPDREAAAPTGQATGQTAEQADRADESISAAAGPVADAPAGPAPLSDPFVAAAERAIDAAGFGGPAESAPPAQPSGPTTGTGPDPSPYGPQSSGPYATGGGEHARPDDAAGPATDAVAPPAPDAVAPPVPGSGRPVAPASAVAPADPYAFGQDEHTRPAADVAPTDAAGAAVPDPSQEHTQDHTQDDAADDAPLGARRTTVTGLPKRTPKIVSQQAPAGPRKSGGVNAEALRRRLGGFQQGAREGRREVEAEISDATPERTIPQTDTDGAGAPGESDIVEEARD
ncbi:nitrate- and nitrite sensing domain-containing protein [Streptomyces sp. NPDC017993]|uniref:sensor histidine kinase n=1 Tax=Streptomyces sp. NPDC017993 TaxID=3365027 RepID=UPI0037A14E13